MIPQDRCCTVFPEILDFLVAYSVASPFRCEFPCSCFYKSRVLCHLQLYDIAMPYLAISMSRRSLFLEELSARKCVHFSLWPEMLGALPGYLWLILRYLTHGLCLTI